ncbi:MAG: hypothetical protein Q9188_002283 [Gyalolechia gomerana]
MAFYPTSMVVALSNIVYQLWNIVYQFWNFFYGLRDSYWIEYDFPSRSNLRTVRLASPSHVNRLLIQHEQALLDTCAQNRNVEVAILLLSHYQRTILYPCGDDIYRRDDSLSPQQFLLERAAYHNNPPLFRYLLSTYPNLDIGADTLGFNAVCGGSVEIWKCLVEKEPRIKDRRFGPGGHMRSVVDQCVMLGKTQILRYLLEQGARVEDEWSPVLQRIEIVQPKGREEIERWLKEAGADTEWREKMED